jgi:hypothetical protein
MVHLYFVASFVASIQGAPGIVTALVYIRRVWIRLDKTGLDLNGLLWKRFRLDLITELV